MNVFITTGTYDFLKKIEAKYPNELILTLVNPTGALLFHETSGKTVFQAPRNYEVFAANGKLSKEEGFVVMSHLPVTDEGRPLIEYQVKNGIQAFEMLSGFRALRALRPLSSNTYILMTVWTNEASYDNVKGADPFANLSDPQIFAGAAYINKYSITE